MLIEDSERKRQQLSENVGNESEKKRPTINCKKKDCMIVYIKQELRIGIIRIELVQKFNYLAIVTTANGKCNNDISRPNVKAKYASHRLNNVLQRRKYSFEIEKRVLNF